MLHVHAAILRRAFLTIFSATYSHQCNFDPIFTQLLQLNLSLLPRKIFALQSLSMPFQAIQQFAIYRKPTTPPKPHFDVCQQRIARVAAATASADSATLGPTSKSPGSSTGSWTTFAVPIASAPWHARAVKPAHLPGPGSAFPGATPHLRGRTLSLLLPARPFAAIASTPTAGTMQKFPRSTTAAPPTPRSLSAPPFPFSLNSPRSPSVFPYPPMTAPNFLDFLAAAPAAVSPVAPLSVSQQIRTPSPLPSCWSTRGAASVFASIMDT